MSIRLATYRNGVPKGHAYIEFTNADDASKALVATNGLEFRNKILSVSISEPPVRDGSGPQGCKSITSEEKKVFKTPQIINLSGSHPVGTSVYVLLLICAIAFIELWDYFSSGKVPTKNLGYTLLLINLLFYRCLFMCISS